eukprot:2505660-Rhodomonas_salina.2
MSRSSSSVVSSGLQRPNFKTAVWQCCVVRKKGRRSGRSTSVNLSLILVWCHRQIEDPFSDAWKLEPVIDILKEVRASYSP